MCLNDDRYPDRLQCGPCFCGYATVLAGQLVVMVAGDRHYRAQCITMTPKVVQPAPEHHFVDVGEQMDLFEVAS
jgi:hypothetical protein